jgi:isopentenyl-diphosphate Delta-isomerase
MSSIFQKMHSKNLWKTKYQVNRLLLPLTNFFNRKTGAHNQAFESEKQELFMDHENCILVDENDKNIGFASKRDCHELKNNGLRLHRAFSVFLFNNNGEMLLQKRSNNKITFPNLYSNACCSHPLDNIENEREETNAIGVKRAAQRRLNYELGIPLDQVNLSFYL